MSGSTSGCTSMFAALRTSMRALSTISMRPLSSKTTAGASEGACNGAETPAMVAGSSAGGPPCRAWIPTSNSRPMTTRYAARKPSFLTTTPRSASAARSRARSSRGSPAEPLPLFELGVRLRLFLDEAIGDPDDTEANGRKGSRRCATNLNDDRILAGPGRRERHLEDALLQHSRGQSGLGIARTVAHADGG